MTPQAPWTPNCTEPEGRTSATVLWQRTSETGGRTWTQKAPAESEENELGMIQRGMKQPIRRMNPIMVRRRPQI